MDNRTRILDCAQTLFAARGYDAVGVQEIVEMAGVTKPSLYHYFTHKRGLLDALLEERFAELNEGIRQSAYYMGDVTYSLRRVAQVYFDFARKEPVFYRMQLSMQFASPESDSSQAVLGYTIEQVQMIEMLFAQAVRDHGNMAGRQQAYAATFIGVVNTYIGLFLNGQTQLGDTLVYQATHQFMHGIFS